MTPGCGAYPIRVIPANSSFDSVKAIQDLILEQERIETENEEGLLLLSLHGSDDTFSKDDMPMELSPQTSPDATPPGSPMSNLRLKPSKLSSLPHYSDTPPSMEDCSMKFSPVTSVYAVQAASQTSNQRRNPTSTSSLRPSTSSVPGWFTSDSPLTSPDPTPPVSPTSKFQLDLPSIPSLRESTSSVPAWFTSDSPLTSPNITPPTLPTFPKSATSVPSTVKTPTILLQHTLPSPRKKGKSTSVEKSTVVTSSKKGNVTRTRKDNRNRAGNNCRNRKRQEKGEAIDSHYIGRRSAQEKYVQGATAISSDFSVNNASITKPGYVACHTKEIDESKGIYSLEDLVGENSKFHFRLQEWDGSSSMGILDAKNRIIAVLAGHPEDDEWSTVQKEAADALKNLRKDCYIPKTKDGRTPRRGDFTALHCGVSYGGGQKKPQNLRNNVRNRRILDKLNHMKPFRRIAGFASSTMATWLPDLHEHYSAAIDKLHGDDDTLKRVFPSSVYCGASYNLGPKTVCCKHQDSENFACGECSVTSLGDFDYKKGGHLVLWDLRLVIEFPPGCTILLPSAIIAHSNVPIADHERRYSFVQYTSGALFRWIDHGLKSKTEYLASLSSLEIEKEQEKNAIRREKLYSMFPTVTLL